MLGEELYAAAAPAATAPAAAAAWARPSTGVLETFPDFGTTSSGCASAPPAGRPTRTYGATGKPVNGGMPAHESLTDAELAQVILYERAAFGGLEEGSEEYLLLEEIAEGLTTFAEAGLGPESEAAGVDEAALGG